MMFRTGDRAPWLLLPLIVLTLGSVTLLAPRRPAQAAPPPAAAQPAAPAAYDDGDGDELLEHWGSPKYGREARLQMAGIGGGFLLLGTAAAYRRRRRPALRLTQAEVQSAPTAQRKAA